MDYENYFLNTIDKRPIKIIWLGKFESWSYCNKLNRCFNTDIYIIGESLSRVKKHNSLLYDEKDNFDLFVYYSDELLDENKFNELVNYVYTISRNNRKEAVVVYYGKLLKTNGSNISSKILIKHIKETEKKSIKCTKDLDILSLLDVSAAMFDELKAKRRIKELCKTYKAEIG